MIGTLRCRFDVRQMSAGPPPITERSDIARQPAPTIILLRVAALATTALESFRCPSVLQSAQAAEAALCRLESRRQSRCDAIHVVVPRQSGPMRRLLLDLKRAIHNHRLPNANLIGPEIDEVFGCDEEIRADVRAWERDVEEFHRSLTEGRVALDSDWAIVRQGLASVWQNESLQCGILYARPKLYGEIGKHLQLLRRKAELDWRHQKCEITLLAYIYRVSTKTSPFSTLTVTGVGRVAEDTADFSVPDLRSCVSLPILSPELVARIAHLWLARADVAAKAPLETPELIHVEQGRIAFLACSDVGAGGRTGGEVVRQLSNAPLAELVVHLLGTSPGPHSLPSLRRLLASTLECEEPRLDVILQSLKDLGLVRPVLAYDACRPSAAQSLVATALDLDCSDLEAECDIAASVLGRLRMTAESPAHEQAAGLAATESEIKRLLGGGTEVPSGSVVFHRCALSEAVPVPARAFREVTPVLEQILDILPLFNVDLGAASVVQDFFRERCARSGTLAILPSFAELWDYVKGCHEGDGQDPFQRAADKHAITMAATADRHILVAEMRARMGRVACGNVELTKDFLHRWAGRARSFAPRRARLSANFLGQFAMTGDSESLTFVLNGVAPGYGALAAGWASTSSTESGGVQLRSSLVGSFSALDPEGDVAEIAAPLDFGGQVRECLTARFLAYPGSPCLTDMNRRIKWDNLGLFLDRGLDRVVLGHRTNLRRVLPVHLGTISPRHFPPFYRFLVALGPAFTPSFSVIDFVEEELTATERLTPRRYARVTAGPLILSRETWCIPSAYLPKFGGAVPTFLEYLELRRWARRLDLPRRAFVTRAQPAEILRDGLDLHTLRRGRKPFYVDFDDYSSCVLFIRYTRRTGPTVRFSEVTPWGAENPFRDLEGPRVVEVAIEVQGGRLP
jgi:Lantibiotic dehydratase, N terminus